MPPFPALTEPRFQRPPVLLGEALANVIAIAVGGFVSCKSGRSPSPPPPPDAGGRPPRSAPSLACPGSLAPHGAWNHHGRPLHMAEVLPLGEIAWRSLGRCPCRMSRPRSACSALAWTTTRVSPCRTASVYVLTSLSGIRGQETGAGDPACPPAHSRLGGRDAQTLGPPHRGWPASSATGQTPAHEVMHDRFRLGQ